MVKTITGHLMYFVKNKMVKQAHFIIATPFLFFLTACTAQNIVATHSDQIIQTYRCEQNISLAFIQSKQDTLSAQAILQRGSTKEVVKIKRENQSDKNDKEEMYSGLNQTFAIIKNNQMLIAYTFDPKSKQQTSRVVCHIIS